MFPAFSCNALPLYNSPVADTTDLRDARGIILFDGTCHLCLGSVRFLLRHDSRAGYRFAWLQSPAARRLLSDVVVPAADSVVFVQRGRVYFRSTAILRALSGLGGGWKLVGVLLLIPRFLRDAVYDYIGARRYRWFGQSTHCSMPVAAATDRFLVDGMQTEMTSSRSNGADTHQS